ncbi:unnamed protein product [Prorocentrum cordatum]|uniref:Uncharacterized protein n=1 Tax=Prorocentrum cordatum TaxID=2364126 RepID=A0ABN9SMX1_9DINO|nr:unnamed protein product [Polarella glacialis]
MVTHGDLPMLQARGTRARHCATAAAPEHLTWLDSRETGPIKSIKAQARKLRATIQRRTACAGASGQAPDVAAILAHYGTVLAEIEEQIGQLLKDASPPEAPVDAAEPAPTAPATGEVADGKKFQKRVSFGVEEALPDNGGGEPGNPSVRKRPAAGSVSTVATVSTVCSSSGEPQP